LIGRRLLESNLVPPNLGDVPVDDAPLERTLRQAAEGEPLDRDDAGLACISDQIRAVMEDAPTPGTVRADPEGTPFQREVWRHLQAIPRGETRTYRQVAEAMGRPTAARAVARACATNPVSLLIPCHRVIRGDGELGGYRWGLSKKIALLNMERRVRRDQSSSSS
ncbi:MAG: methylated-DNA--[protein]-cysteine S-methyltransferase, partial [Gemmataceae bacterium]